MSFCFLYAGVFQPLDQTAASELAYINPLYYSECLINRITFLDGREYIPIGFNSTSGLPPMITRGEALDRYSLVTPAWASALVLVGLLIGSRVLAFVVLHRKFGKVLLTSQSAGATASCCDRLLSRQAAEPAAPEPAESAQPATPTESSSV